MFSIHGLDCDQSVDDASSYPRDCFDHSVVDFSLRAESEGHEPVGSHARFMVMLPKGTGLGSTFEAALSDAAANQRANLRGGR